MPHPETGSGQEVAGQNSGEKDTGQMDERRNLEAPATAGAVPPQPVGQAGQAVHAAAAQSVAPTIPHGQTAASTAVGAGLDADDGDLIEKSWIDRAKAIVDQTRSDPHRQNSEINKVKKEYIQKRYHKDIKLNE